MPFIAIAGNPNAGKSSIFTSLTGTHQQVSNYPGVTVERKEGAVRWQGRRITVLDLPGTYSLTAYSQEEVVARNAIIGERPDVVVDVVDASNLERNLYLTVQLMEMRVPMVIALNMVDVAARRGMTIDTAKLSALLGVPIVETVGSKGKGMDELLEACVGAMDAPRKPKPVTYGHEVSREVENLAALLAGCGPLVERYEPRWVAVKLLEQDPHAGGEVRSLCGERAEDIERAAAKARLDIERHFGEDLVTIIAERRYGFAAGALKECVTLRGEARQEHTDRIDAIVCSRAVGPLVLVGVVAALFFFVFKLSDEWRWIPWVGGWRSPTGIMDWVFEGLSRSVSGLEKSMPMLYSLLDDGIISGVGGVMGFVPLIFLLFLFVSFLEDTGYIARVAFMLDRVLRVFGMQGKSILALIVSGGLGAGGCAVPGVLATRTLREEKDRLVTMLVIPFMNCGAKMPVHAMLIAAFFPSWRTGMMMLLWAISWAVTLCAAWVLRRFVVRGEQTPFVMELPPYHLPTLRGTLIHTWERTWMYVKKAGTVILAISILLWAFMYFPRMSPDETARAAAAVSLGGNGANHATLQAQRLAHSFAGRLGTALEPVSRLAGFDWRVNVALIGGFAAKEVVLGTLGTLYSMGKVDEEQFESLSLRLAHDSQWNRLKGFTLMLFVMLYAPCLVTVSVIRRESGSWKWAAFSTVYSTTIAFTLAAGVYQLGRLF